MLKEIKLEDYQVWVDGCNPDTSREDWENIFKVMRKPAWLFDTRAVTNLNDYKFKGINYWSIGRGIRS